MKRLLVTAMLAAFLLSLAADADARWPTVVPHCRMIVGKWFWSTGGIVTIMSDGTVVHQPVDEGTWECTDPARKIFTILWNRSGSVDTVFMSNDNRHLSGTNQENVPVTATREGLPPFPF